MTISMIDPQRINVATMGIAPVSQKCIDLLEQSARVSELGSYCDHRSFINREILPPNNLLLYLMK